MDLSRLGISGGLVHRACRICLWAYVGTVSPRLGKAATAVSPPPPGVPATRSCLATLRKKFHLREGPTLASKGPQYPGGTTLELLEHTELTRLGARLFKVRVRSNAQIGFAFVGAPELAASCKV